MRVVVTGGAGYIGSHVVRMLRQRGDSVSVVDDLSNGVRSRIADVTLHQLDLASPLSVDELSGILLSEQADAVIHFAARKRVDESVRRPAYYYGQNIGSLSVVLQAIEASGISRLIFSSSAAVYGSTTGAAISEDDPAMPVNPYGATKLVGEQLVDAATRAFPLIAASLRYFNVAGAGWQDLADTAVLNLIPMVFDRMDAGRSPLIFGDDYGTSDGTCVRDFIHVADLAAAHLAMLDHLDKAARAHEIVNVGTGRGSSVREVVDRILAVSGSSLSPEVRPRRAGDPAAVVADPGKIEALTGWRAQRSLEEIVVSAWQAHRDAPTASPFRAG